MDLAEQTTLLEALKLKLPMGRPRDEAHDQSAGAIPLIAKSGPFEPYAYRQKPSGPPGQHEHYKP